MKLDKIKAEVQGIVADPRFDGELVGFINSAYVNAVCEAKLPEYKKFGSLTTISGENCVAVSDFVDDFAGSVEKVFPVQGRRVVVYSSLEEMISKEGIDSLDLIETEIKAIALEGDNLWYYPIPSTPLIINFLYIAKPEELESDYDEIKLFPELIQRMICVHGACVFCFETIEDALENPEKLNTNYHRKEYEKGIQKLKEWNGRRRTHKTTSSWSV